MLPCKPMHSCVMHLRSCIREITKQLGGNPNDLNLPIVTSDKKKSEWVHWSLSCSCVLTFAFSDLREKPSIQILSLSFRFFLGVFPPFREEISKRSSKRIVYYLVRENLAWKICAWKFFLWKTPLENYCLKTFLCNFGNICVAFLVASFLWSQTWSCELVLYSCRRCAVHSLISVSWRGKPECSIHMDFTALKI